MGGEWWAVGGGKVEVAAVAETAVAVKARVAVTHLVVDGALLEESELHVDEALGPGVAALDGLLHPRLRPLALGHAEALRDHHDLKEAVETVAADTVVRVVEARVARVVVQAKVAAAMVAAVAMVARLVQETAAVVVVVAGSPSSKRRGAPCPPSSWRP